MQHLLPSLSDDLYTAPWPHKHQCLLLSAISLIAKFWVFIKNARFVRLKTVTVGITRFCKMKRLQSLLFSCTKLLFKRTFSNAFQHRTATK